MLTMGQVSEDSILVNVLVGGGTFPWSSNDLAKGFLS